MRRWGLAVLAVAGIGLGLIAERTLYGWADPRHWIPDLFVGWTLIACGLVAWERRPLSWAGALMAATGFAWFLGNFADVGVAFAAWLSARTTQVYHGPLVHVLLTYPTGRASTRLTRGAVAAGYVAAIITPLWANDVGAIVLACLIVGVSARQYVRVLGRSRRSRLLSLQAATGLGIVVAGSALARLAVPSGDAVAPSHLAYEAALMALAGVLLAGLLSAPWERAAMTDLVVELGEARSGTLRGELARALGDPTLEVGYWVPGSDAFVDVEGGRLSLPEPDSERSVTLVEREGRPVAALVHDPTVLGDPALIQAVSSATQLDASNARLQAEVRAQLADLTASRRRILEAGDEERRRLEHRLREGAEEHLAELAVILRRAALSANGEGAEERIVQAGTQLTGTLEELRRLANGLHPRDLTELGLEGALQSLGDRAPIPVRVDVSADAIPSTAEAAAYFVCSEALANVAKYSHASTVTMSVTSSGEQVRVEIQDDGVGGADPSKGTGLRGLADRIEALGGSIEVESSLGRGTRLTAIVPLADWPTENGSRPTVQRSPRSLHRARR